MGIEIGDLDISLNLEDRKQTEKNGGEKTAGDGCGDLSKEKAEIVADCVREVLAILREKQER